MRLLLVCVMLLTGCAHKVWVRPGATTQDFARDQNDCLVKANQAGYPGGGFSAGLARQRFIEQCMNGQGWTLDKASE